MKKMIRKLHNMEFFLELIAFIQKKHFYKRKHLLVNHNDWVYFIFKLIENITQDLQKYKFNFLHIIINTFIAKGNF